MLKWSLLAWINSLYGLNNVVCKTRITQVTYSASKKNTLALTNVCCCSGYSQPSLNFNIFAKQCMGVERLLLDLIWNRLGTSIGQTRLFGQNVLFFFYFKVLLEGSLWTSREFFFLFMHFLCHTWIGVYACTSGGQS